MSIALSGLPSRGSSAARKAVGRVNKTNLRAPHESNSGGFSRSARSSRASRLSPHGAEAVTQKCHNLTRKKRCFKTRNCNPRFLGAMQRLREALPRQQLLRGQGRFTVLKPHRHTVPLLCLSSNGYLNPTLRCSSPTATPCRSDLSFERRPWTAYPGQPPPQASASVCIGLAACLGTTSGRIVRGRGREQLYQMRGSVTTSHSELAISSPSRSSGRTISSRWTCTSKNAVLFSILARVLYHCIYPSSFHL